MDRERALLKFLLLILVCVILGFASWRIMSYTPSDDDTGGLFSFASSHVRGKQSKKNKQKYLSEVERLKQEEILQNRVSAPAPDNQTDKEKELDSIIKSAKPAAWSNFVPRTIQKNNFLGAGNYYDEKPYTQATNTLAGRNTYEPNNTTYDVRENKAVSTPEEISRNRKREEERAEMLSAYLKPNREIEAKLNRTLDSLAANIQTAIDKIIKPQSKKNKNIEKYGHNKGKETAASAGDTNAFNRLLAQVSSQGDSIVQNVTKAFGNKAGNEMAALVKQFEQELSGAVNTPGATSGQIADKVKDISKKYQDKINKLANKQQYDKFVQDRTEQDNKQKQELGQFYKGEVMQEISDILDKAREQELELASKNLPEKEYWDAVLKNNYQKQVDMREAITKAGESLSGFNKWLDAQERRAVEQQVKAEEEGLVASYAAALSEEHFQAKQAALKKEKTDLYNQMLNGYGQEGADEMGKMYQEYAAKMTELAKTPLSDAKRAQQEMELRRQYNEKIAQWQKTTHARQMAVKQGATNVLNSIFEQNPAIAQDQQQRAQFETQARPVIEQAMAQIIDVQNDEKLSAAQKQQEINRIQSDLERTLSGGGQ